MGEHGEGEREALYAFIAEKNENWKSFNRMR